MSNDAFWVTDSVLSDEYVDFLVKSVRVTHLYTESEMGHYAFR